MIKGLWHGVQTGSERNFFLGYLTIKITITYINVILQSDLKFRPKSDVFFNNYACLSIHILQTCDGYYSSDHCVRCLTFVIVFF